MSALLQNLLHLIDEAASTFFYGTTLRGDRVYVSFKVKSLGDFIGRDDPDNELPELEVESVCDLDDNEIEVTPQEKEALEDEGAEAYFNELYLD